MANKDFGVKKIELIGSSGTPNLTSPTNLNLNANTVAISTDVTIGGKVQSDVIVGTGYSVGIGSTQPQQALDVDGTIRATSFEGDLTGGNITLGSYSLVTLQGDKIVLGDTSRQFEIFTDTSGNTYMRNVATGGNTGGDLRIRSDEILIQKYDGTETIAQFTEGAGVDLRHRGYTRLETTSDGVSVTGDILVTGGISTNGIGTAVSLNIVGNDLVITVGSLSTTLTLS